MSTRLVPAAAAALKAFIGGLPLLLNYVSMMALLAMTGQTPRTCAELWRTPSRAVPDSH